MIVGIGAFSVRMGMVGCFCGRGLIGRLGDGRWEG